MTPILTQLRRQRRALWWASIVALCAGPAAACMGSPADSEVPAGVRQSLCLNGRWLLQFDEHDDGEYMAWYRSDLSAQGWKRVRAPQAWNVLPGREEYRGAAWYRRTFHVPPSFRGQHVVIRFTCAAHRVKVWLNERALGVEQAAYVPFHFDATDALRLHGPNVLAVRCDNSPLHGSTETMPWGGLLGTVTVEASSRSHVAGVRVRTEMTGGDVALVDVKVTVRNTAPEPQKAELRLYVSPEPLHDSAPTWRMVGRQAMDLAATSTAAAELSFALNSPARWHFDDPALYRVRAELVDAAGRRVDTFTKRFGVRDVRVAGERLLLNGEWVRLVGVARFADHPSGAMAETRDAVARDLACIRHMNGVLCRVRAAAPHPHLVDACDERGVLLTAGLPVWDPTPAELADRGVVDQAKALLTRMIEVYGDRPSVWSWSLGEGIPDDTPEGIAYVAELRALAKRLDPSRPVTFTRADHEPAPGQASGDVDYISVPGFFGARTRTSSLGGALDRVHAVWPGKMVVVSGWGGYNDGAAATETAVAKAVMEQLAEVRKRPFVAGLVWGSLSHYRSPTERADGYDKKRKVVQSGLLTRDRSPLSAYFRLSQEFAPVRIMGLAYRSDTFAAGEPLTAMVGLVIASPVSGSLPCYRLNSYTLRWTGAGTGFQAIPPFRPDYFAQSPRSVAWQPVVWTPSEDGSTSPLVIDVLRPTGLACAKRTCRIRCRASRGRMPFERPMVLLDLAPYCNCDGVSSDTNRMAGNFDTPHLPSGASYPAAELPESHSVFVAARDKKKEAVPFLFPDKDSPANNIACSGQSVIVPPDRYARLHMLAAAENGSFEHAVTLVYADGATQAVLWGLGDWCGKPHPSEQTVITCKYRHGWGGQVERDKPCYIRWQDLPVDPNRTLHAVRLPELARMHVFAITLATP